MSAPLRGSHSSGTAKGSEYPQQPLQEVESNAGGASQLTRDTLNGHIGIQSNSRHESFKVEDGGACNPLSTRMAADSQGTLKASGESYSDSAIGRSP